MRQSGNVGRTRQVTEDNTIRCMSVTYWISKATDTNSEYVILIAFPRQHCLLESASLLRCTYNVCLVLFVSGVPRGGGLGCSNPPPKFRSFDKAEPNSQFHGKYIPNNLTRIRLSLIFWVVAWKAFPPAMTPTVVFFFSPRHDVT